MLPLSVVSSPIPHGSCASCPQQHLGTQPLATQEPLSWVTYTSTQTPVPWMSCGSFLPKCIVLAHFSAHSRRLIRLNSLTEVTQLVRNKSQARTQVQSSK